MPANETTARDVRAPRRILVTGAAGFVGAAIAAHLAGRGHHVLTTDLVEHPGGLCGDLRDTEFRSKLLHWASPHVVVHAAALVPLTRDIEGFSSTNVNASRELARDAQRGGAERFVLIGSSAVYGIPRAHPITRRTPTRPVEEYGRSKLLAEDATRRGWGSQGLTILRPRTVVGDGRRGIIDTLARWIRDEAVLPLPRGGRHRLQLVHVEDVARMVLHVIEHEVDGTWPVGAPGAERFDEELNELIRRSDSSSRILPVPRPLFRFLAMLADRAGLMPFTRWHYLTLGHDFAFDETWKPDGFHYLHRNDDALATVLFPAADGDAEGTSPHTRSWSTGALDRAVRVLTVVERVVRLIMRLITWFGSRTTSGLAGPGGADEPRTAGERAQRKAVVTTAVTTIVLRRLVAYPDHDVEQRAQSTLRRHYLASSPVARLGMIAAAVLVTSDGTPTNLPGPLATIAELGGKLRSAHLTSALHEPEPLEDARPGDRPNGHARRRSRPRTDEDVDVLVVGSGPGAAMSVHAAGTGTDVLVVEAGTRSNVPTERHHGLEHLLGDFADGGAGMCLARPLTQIAEGRVLGGGSEVNSGFHHDLPEDVRHRWCRDLGIDEDEWQRAEDEVRELLVVSVPDSQHERSVIARGASSLGQRHERIARWRSYEGSGFVQHGMTRQIWDRNPQVRLRTGSVVTHLETFPDHIAAVLDDGTRIRSRRVVLAAGTLNTPRILIRSGLLPRKEARFNLHPMVRVVARCHANDYGRYDVDPFQAWGADGFKFGGAVSTPSLLGAATGRTLDERDVSELRSFYASFRPTGHGGFTPGLLLPWYHYSRDDRQALETGARQLCELLAHAGVEPLTDAREAADAPSSVHIFASLPAGTRTYLPGTSRLTADPRVSVSDASLLPGPVGVNPQGIVMTLALLVARRSFL
jgi:nucleoside-diphosphate-sugar epimerase